MKKTTDNIVASFPWWGWFIITFIVSFIGCVLLGRASSYLASASGPYYYSSMERWAACFYPGLFFICVSIVLDVFVLKELITEAHVRALEIFYGKKREIGFGLDNEEKASLKKTRKNESVQSWSDYLD